MIQQFKRLSLENHTLEDGALFYSGELPAQYFWSVSEFELAWSLHPPEKHRIYIHGREVETPRYQQSYIKSYEYTGRVNEALPAPELLKPFLQWVQVEIDDRLNGILLNWYDGPDHYIGPHHDSTKNLIEGTPIITVSFGETRVFRLSRGKGPSRLTHEYSAPNGTLFVMPFQTNLSWKHEVKKSRRYTGRRISVTFRAFVD